MINVQSLFPYWKRFSFSTVGSCCLSFITNWRISWHIQQKCRGTHFCFVFWKAIGDTFLKSSIRTCKDGYDGLADVEYVNKQTTVPFIDKNDRETTCRQTVFIWAGIFVNFNNQNVKWPRNLNSFLKTHTHTKKKRLFRHVVDSINQIADSVRRWKRKRTKWDKLGEEKRRRESHTGVVSTH